MKSLPLQFLKDKGLLFELNRAVLHPLGLTLQVDDDGRAELLQTDDPAGMLFTQSDFLDGESRLMEFMNAEGSSRLAARKAFLQFVEQVNPDQAESIRPPPPDDSGSVG